MMPGYFCGRLQNRIAECARCCATFSQQGAMSDHSNSTGSSGSSTNSWTLLSPEVRHTTGLTTGLQAPFQCQDVNACLCLQLKVSHKDAMVQNKPNNASFSCSFYASVVYLARAGGTFPVYFFVIHYVFCGLCTVQIFSHCIFYT